MYAYAGIAADARALKSWLRNTWKMAPAQHQLPFIRLRKLHTLRTNVSRIPEPWSCTEAAVRSKERSVVEKRDLPGCLASAAGMFHVASFRSALRLRAGVLRMPVVKRDITEFARGDDSRRVVVRLIDGSAFVSVSLELAGRSRVLNRYKNEPLAQTLKRVQLAHVATMMVSKAKSQSASSERGTSKGQSAAKPPAVSLLGKNGKELSGELNNEKAWTEAMALVIGDRHYTVVQNPPSIVSLSLPELVMVGITVTPSLHLEFCEPHMCDFRWFLSNPDAPAGSEPDMVSTDPTFTPCEEHKGRLLAVEVIPKRDGVAGVPLRIAPLTEVSGAPTKLLFKKRVAHTPTPHNIGSKDMRVCTYNVLADQYLKMGDMHFYCPQHARDFSYRSQLLLAEMLGYNVDIFCLQEVDKGHFARFFEPQLKSRGFSGLLTLKMKVNEGCAIFWRDDRLKLVKQHDYLLRDEIVKMKLWDKLCNLPEFESAMRTRTTIMQALEMEFEGRPLLVANTHLYYHAEARHIRLLQSTTITHVLEELQAECSQRAGQTVPVLFLRRFKQPHHDGRFRLLPHGRAVSGASGLGEERERGGTTRHEAQPSLWQHQPRPRRSLFKFRRRLWGRSRPHILRPAEVGEEDGRSCSEPRRPRSEYSTSLCPISVRSFSSRRRLGIGKIDRHF